MSLRTAVFEALRTDAPLAVLLNSEADAVLPNFAAVDPASDLARWVILRWGAAESPPGRDTSARAIALTVAAYDREKDYAGIEAILKRCRTVLRSLERSPTGEGGWILDVGDPAFSSEDLYDDAYLAVVRSETYRLVASGT
jgi:hypothetical protein